MTKSRCTRQTPQLYGLERDDGSEPRGDPGGHRHRIRHPGDRLAVCRVPPPGRFLLAHFLLDLS